jgi:hypothetical protein
MKEKFGCFRHEQGLNNEIVPLFTDRSVSDRVVRARIGPGGKLRIFLLSKFPLFRLIESR